MAERRLRLCSRRRATSMFPRQHGSLDAEVQLTLNVRRRRLESREADLFRFGSSATSATRARYASAARASTSSTTSPRSTARPVCPTRTRAVNATAVRTVVEAAAAGGARRVVHCSTVGVHGDIEHPPADEDAPLRPGDIYQETKVEGERHRARRGRGTGVEVVIARPTGIYGPGDRRLLKLFRGVARRRFVDPRRREDLLSPDVRRRSGRRVPAVRRGAARRPAAPTSSPAGK